ncbi:hypothetical protein, partial [Paenibacillus odorifer]
LLFNKTIDFFSIFNFQESSYTTRFDSVSNVINSFRNEGWGTFLLGSGAGTANMELVPGNGFEIYVENFHLSLLYDAGFIIFIFWAFLNSKIILTAITKRKYFHMSVIIFGLLLVNMFSSNLTSYSIQILYWLLICKLILDQRDDTKLFLINSSLDSSCE